jgi:hypothetical protein
MAELTPPPETPRAPAAITEVLKLLQSLMAGRALTVAEAARRHRYQEAAVRRHLLAIQTVFREVVADKVGRGHVFRFVWPRQQASDATTVLALQIARTALVSLRGSALDGKLAELVQDHLARNADPRVQAHDLGRLFWSHRRVHAGATATDLRIPALQRQVGQAEAGAVDAGAVRRGPVPVRALCRR